jgi:hypothetical protein
MAALFFLGSLGRTCAGLPSKLLFWLSPSQRWRVVVADFCGSEVDNPIFPRMTMMRVSAPPSVNALRENFKECPNKLFDYFQ